MFSGSRGVAVLGGGLLETIINADDLDYILVLVDQVHLPLA